jgi:hypothetical protein
MAFNKLSIVVVGNLLGQNFYVPPFMATYNNLEVLVHTWSPHFVLFLSEDNASPTMVLVTWPTWS